MTFTVTDAYDGRLLRSYLKLTLGLSSAVLAGLKNREDGILVNGRRVTVRYVLHTGDTVTLADRDTPETATERVIPVELPLEVLYENDHIIALSKPAGMPTHPSHGHLCDTLANALAYRYLTAEEPFVFRPLGRLDRNTSGVVMVGKTRAAAGHLSRSLQKGLVHKRYLAIVVGEMTGSDEWQSVDAPLYRPDDAGIRRAVWTGETAVVGRPGSEVFAALTRYRVLAVGGGLSLVLCEPVTGRTHQLRVHLSHIGHPILGDEIYGAPSPLIPRHALHAVSLSVPLPFFAEAASIPGTPILNAPDAAGRLTAWAPLPPDMAAVAWSCFDRQMPLLSHDAPPEAILRLAEGPSMSHTYPFEYDLPDIPSEKEDLGS